MNILIVEDEPKTAKLLKELIEAYDEENIIIAVCDSIEGAVNYIKSAAKKIDLFFMDILLADGNSFEIFKQVKITAPVIFCTAYDNYVLSAFKSNGIDYILKPFHEKDIENAFEKLAQLKTSLTVSDIAATQLANALKPHAAQQSSFLVKFRDKMYPVQVRDIALVSLENEILYTYTFNNEKHPVFKSIDEVEAVLDARQFFRINRQMLINREAIISIEPFFNRRVIIKPKISPQEKPVVSRLKVTAFLEWVEKA